MDTDISFVGRDWNRRNGNFGRKTLDASGLTEYHFSYLYYLGFPIFEWLSAICTFVWLPNEAHIRGKLITYLYTTSNFHNLDFLVSFICYA